MIASLHNILIIIIYYTIYIIIVFFFIIDERSHSIFLKTKKNITSYFSKIIRNCPKPLNNIDTSEFPCIMYLYYIYYIIVHLYLSCYLYIGTIVIWVILFCYVPIPSIISLILLTTIWYDSRFILYVLRKRQNDE